MALTARRGRLSYQDNNDKRTTVVWENAAIAYAVTEYINRVEGEQGIIEGELCLADKMFSDITTEYCGAGNPLSIKWAGERYDVTKPSSASIRLLIQNATEKASIDYILDEPYTVAVYKEDSEGNNILFWRGQLTTDVYSESYSQFPYALTLNANDALKMSEDNQFLMTDFNDNVSVYGESLLSILIKYIRIALKPNVTFDLYVTNTGLLPDVDGTSVALWTLMIDPRVFMYEDKDEYLPFKDMLNLLLDPLDLQLFQWEGSWWLMSQDFQWNDGDVSAYKFKVTPNTYYGDGSYTPDVDGIVNLYNGDEDNREVRENSSVSYLPAWNKTEITSLYQANRDALDMFNNRGGNFYNGITGSTLEFEEYRGHLYTADMRESTLTTDTEGNSDAYTYYENDGWFGMKMVYTSGNTYRYKIFDLPYTPDTLYSNLRIEMDFFDFVGGITSPTASELVYHQFMIKIYDGVNTRYLYYNDDDELGWNSNFRTITHKGNSFNETLKLLYYITESDATIEFRYYNPIYSPVFQQTVPSFMRGLKISLYPDELFADGYKTVTNTNINTGYTHIEKREFKFAVVNPTIADNIHLFHYSTPTSMMDTGVPITLYSNAAGNFGSTLKGALEWKLDALTRDNSSKTKVLEGDYLSKDISPIQLVKDFEGITYKFTNGTLNDKTGIWKVKLTEFKALPEPLKGSFSALSFDNSFQKTIT